MKKLVVLIVIVLAFGLNACTKSQKPTEQSSMPSTSEQAPSGEQEAPAAAQ